MRTKDNKDLAEREAHYLMHTSAEKKKMLFYADPNEGSTFSCPRQHQKPFYTITIQEKYKKVKGRKSKIIDLSSWPCDKIARIQSSFDDNDWHGNYQSHSAQSPGQKD
tara:strand:- start:1609 stop:1932 length:324 start_codon:yes stop_codon:yes gene_type:complete